MAKSGASTKVGDIRKTANALGTAIWARFTAQHSIVAAKAPIAVGFIIDAVNQGLEAPFAVGEYLETSLFGTIASSEDMREGTKAFLDKRKPVWQGK